MSGHHLMMPESKGILENVGHIGSAQNQLEGAPSGKIHGDSIRLAE